MRWKGSYHSPETGGDMPEPVKIGLVGCGGMAGLHIRGLKTLWEAGLRDFLVEACCDPVEENAKKLADELESFQGIRPRIYPSIIRMLRAEGDLDAVDICTMHRLHHKLACYALERGLHVTIEKPLAVTMRAGKLILQTAQRNGRLVQVAENYRRSPENRAVKWALEQGRIGKPRMIFWISIGERLWHWGWREYIKDAGGGWTLDGGVHFADLFRYHIGEVETVFSRCRAFHPYRYEDTENLGGRIKVDAEDTTVSILEFVDGALGQWTSTSSAPGDGLSHCAIYGERGSYVFGRGLKTLSEQVPTEELVKEFMKAISQKERERLFPLGVTDTVATELKEFVDAVSALKDGATRPPKLETDGVEGYKDQAICFAVYESGVLGKPVSVRSIENLRVERYQSRINSLLRLK